MLDITTSAEVLLHAINRSCEALLENVLVIVDNLQAEHKRAVGKQVTNHPFLEELAQEVVLCLCILLLIVVKTVAYHDHRAVLVRLSESGQQSREVNAEIALFLRQVRSDDNSLNERISCVAKHVVDALVFFRGVSG